MITKPRGVKSENKSLRRKGDFQVYRMRNSTPLFPSCEQVRQGVKFGFSNSKFLILILRFSGGIRDLPPQLFWRKLRHHLSGKNGGCYGLFSEVSLTPITNAHTRVYAECNSVLHSRRPVVIHSAGGPYITLISKKRTRVLLVQSYIDREFVFSYPSVCYLCTSRPIVRIFWKSYHKILFFFYKLD